MNYELFLMIPAHSVAHHCPTLAENRYYFYHWQPYGIEGEKSML
jgi:hypothetical protein